ncbi:hypothetical protein BH11MYX1_BH11MYX1_56250 [soil metagenome]
MRALIFTTLMIAFAPACGDNAGSSSKKDAGVVVDAPSGIDASCFTNPQTHEEIINACTSAQKIYKATTLPLLGADGTLPPLP